MEQLRNILNVNKLAREEQFKRVEKIELKSPEIPVHGMIKYFTPTNLPSKRPEGFTALVSSNGSEFKLGETVHCFTQVRLNHGNHFDPSTGKFTVPSNGVYLISVCVEKCSGQVMLHLVKQQPIKSSCNVINQVVVNDKETNACLVAVEELLKDEELMIRSYNQGSLRRFSSFSCFRIF
ncbi:unnamed protein product [Lymnaea stagnalis]